MKFWLIIPGILLILVALILTEWIPDRALTITRMHVVKRRILQSCKINDKIPISLTEIAEKKGYDNSIEDAWGQKLIYHTSTSIISLKSYGADAKLGGKGEDEDLIFSFPLKDENGNWSHELVDWIADKPL